jgi:hypothetical protein
MILQRPYTHTLCDFTYRKGHAKEDLLLPDLHSHRPRAGAASLD